MAPKIKNPLNAELIENAIEYGQTHGYLDEKTQAQSAAVASQVMAGHSGDAATSVTLEQLQAGLGAVMGEDQAAQLLNKAGPDHVTGALDYINQAKDATDQQQRIAKAVEALRVVAEDPKLFDVEIHRNVIQTPFLDRLPKPKPFISSGLQ
ncbi:MAG: hypothetical protein JXR83_06620 [Deltaproteobacteria bacterium]|nr:hypothetical protein [Deltaproteobacteria bacterium]